MNKLKKKTSDEKTKNDIVGWICFHVTTRFAFDIQKINVSSQRP